jgi:hypothetical protein
VDVEGLRRAIGAERFDAACRERWASDDLLGSRDGPAAEVPHDVADHVWAAGADRLELLFAVYERMPCYAVLMYSTGPFAEDFRDEEKERFWAAYRRLLEQPERRLAEPVLYSLWVDYFEDPSTVEEAWRETTAQTGDWEPRIRRLLPVSGPVPYALKAPLYLRLLPDRRFHEPILEGLVGGARDVFGKLDATKALQIVDKLRLPATQTAELRRELESRTRPRRR